MDSQKLVWSALVQPGRWRRLWPMLWSGQHIRFNKMDSGSSPPALLPSVRLLSRPPVRPSVSVCLPLSLSLPLSVCLSVSLSLSLSLSLYIYIYISIYIYIYIYIYIIFLPSIYARSFIRRSLSEESLLGTNSFSVSNAYSVSTTLE